MPPSRLTLAPFGALLLSACFVDEGGETSESGTTSATAGSTSTSSSSTDVTTDVTTSTGGSTLSTTSTSEPTTSSESTTTGPAGRCGDGVLDPDEACDDGNADENDACLSDCSAASCGDGFVWAGVEECDDGAANDDKTGACRSTCTLPACGDGAIYLGPLGPPQIVGGGPDEAMQSNDSPRAIGVSASGAFAAVWSNNARIYVQPFDRDGVKLGAQVDLAPMNNDDVRDPVLAVGPEGDVAVIWESVPKSGALTLSRRTMMGSVLSPSPVVSLALGTNQAGTVAIGPGAELHAGFSAMNGDNMPMHVFHRRYSGFTGPADGPEVKVSEHLSGDAEPPSLAIAPDGVAVIAWGDPSGPILYRRIDPGGALGPIVQTSLRTGTGNVAPSSRRWSGVAIDGVGRVAIAGVVEGGAVSLQRFGADESPGPIATASEPAPQHAPIVDLAVDGAGNLAIAWTSCGDPMDPAPDCADATNHSYVRWFYADLTPYQAATEVVLVQGGPSPIGVASASDGTTAVLFVVGDAVVARIAAANCP